VAAIVSDDLDLKAGLPLSGAGHCMLPYDFIQRW
jgi:hypothetical protein